MAVAWRFTANGVGGQVIHARHMAVHELSKRRKTNARCVLNHVRDLKCCAACRSRWDERPESGCVTSAAELHPNILEPAAFANTRTPLAHSIDSRISELFSLHNEAICHAPVAPAEPSKLCHSSSWVCKYSRAGTVICPPTCLSRDPEVDRQALQTSRDSIAVGDLQRKD